MRLQLAPRMTLNY